MTGRWPANVILSPSMADALDDQSGAVGGNSVGKNPAAYKVGNQVYSDLGKRKPFGYGESKGGASRFFLNAGYEQWELEWIYSVGLRPCGLEQL